MEIIEDIKEVIIIEGMMMNIKRKEAIIIIEDEEIEGEIIIEEEGVEEVKDMEGMVGIEKMVKNMVIMIGIIKMIGMNI